MTNQDARSLSPDAQEALRKRAVDACIGGMKQRVVARAFGVHENAVSRWMKQHRADAKRGLDARKKGPPEGAGTLLTPKEAKNVRALILDKCPDQLKLPFALWTRDAVSDLIYREYGIRPAVRTAGNYLRDWGFTPQKPVRRAYERNPVAVQAWLDTAYPAIASRAKQENALIYWGDEMGLRSDHAAGRSYGLRGKTPVLRATGKRFGCSMISAVTNQGHLCFRVFEGSFNVDVFLDFLDRMIKQARRKVYLIVDGHPVHRAKVLKAWCEEHKDVLELFRLPTYSPDLNPDELLNQDIKCNVFRKRRPRTNVELKAILRSHLFSRQRRPHIIRSYFQEEHVRYAMPEDA